MALHTCWIYELAELESITNKREAGTLKNLISSVSDLIRPPYLSAHDDFPRMSIFWGSSNRRDFLRDETGSSRYHVIELPHDAEKGFRIDTDRLLRDRDRIWKAAVLAYKAGESNLLSTEQQAENERRNLRYEVEDPWEDYIREWLETATAGALHVRTVRLPLGMQGLRIQLAFCEDLLPSVGSKGCAEGRQDPSPPRLPKGRAPDRWPKRQETTLASCG